MKKETFQFQDWISDNNEQKDLERRNSHQDNYLGEQVAVLVEIKEMFPSKYFSIPEYFLCTYCEPYK